MVTLAMLQTFATVAETGSLREAAARLGRTPSAVSMALSRLEDEIGARLFEGDRKSRLTKAGAFAIVQARELLNHHERAVTTIQALAREAAGRVDVGCVPSVAAMLLPRVVKELRVVAPRVEIRIRDTDSASVVRATEQGELSFGIASAASDRGALAFSPLFWEALGIVCRADDPLAALRPPLSWSALKGRPFLANAVSLAAPCEELRALQAAADVTVYTVTAALGLVRAGLGVTLLSRLAVPPGSRDLRFLALRDRRATRCVGVVSRSAESLSPADIGFIAILRRVVAAERARLQLRLTPPGQ